MDLNRKITKKFTKKFDNKGINRQYFHRITWLQFHLKFYKGHLDKLFYSVPGLYCKQEVFKAVFRLLYI